MIEFPLEAPVVDAAEFRIGVELSEGFIDFGEDFFLFCK